MFTFCSLVDLIFSLLLERTFPFNSVVVFLLPTLSITNSGVESQVGPSSSLENLQRVTCDMMKSN